MEKEMLFVTASRVKLRFESPKGLLTTEDLWALPLSTTVPNKISLDILAQSVHKKINDTVEVSFVGATTTSSEDELRLELLKYVIAVKQEENKAKQDAVAKESRTAQIKELIKQKKNEELSGLSVEELEKLL